MTQSTILKTGIFGLGTEDKTNKLYIPYIKQSKFYLVKAPLVHMNNKYICKQYDYQAVRKKEFDQAPSISTFM